MTVRYTQWLRGTLLMLLFSAAHAVELVPGATAPGFDLGDQQGQRHRLADYRGRWLVLYFYPRDDTPGCTTAR